MFVFICMIYTYMPLKYKIVKIKDLITQKYLNDGVG